MNDTVLKRGSWAIVWSEKGGWRLVTPIEVAIDPKGVVPPEALALTGAFMRLEGEEAFREECRSFFMGGSE